MKSVAKASDYENKNRYHAVDFLKGIGVIFIIVTHYAWTDAERLRFLFPFWIEMAVPIFMIITGAVYAKSYKNRGLYHIAECYSSKLIIKRITRYTIPFFMVFVVESVILNSLGIVREGIVQVVVSWLRGGHGPGGYYYPILIQLVFFYPIIYSLVSKYYFNGLVICGLINLIYEVLKRAYGMDSGCYSLLVFRYTLCVAYGSWVAIRRCKPQKTLTLLCILVGSLYIVATQYFKVVPPVTDFWTGTSMWASMFILPLSAYMINSRISNRIIEYIGEASYDIFLIQKVYYNIVKYVYAYIPCRMLQLVFNIIGCVVVGVLFHKLEESITKWFSDRIYMLYTFLINKWKKYSSKMEMIGE